MAYCYSRYCLLFFAFAEGTLLLLPFEKDIATVRNAPRGRPRKGPFFLVVKTILLATGNAHKASEIEAVLGDSFVFKTLKDLNVSPEIIEDANTFEANATKKAATVAYWVGKTGDCFDWILADDSGLEVDALDGAPGVHSARFASLDTNAPRNSADSENNSKLLHLLAGHPRPWTARFRCVLALTPIPAAHHDSSTCLANEAELATRIFSGACEGQIIPDAQGSHGFGYDPLFVPSGFSETFAQLGDEIKNGISHRAEAMRKLKTALARLL